MGDRIQMGIKARFITYLFKVLLWTGVACGLSLLGMFSLINMGLIRGADYYDKQIPLIRNAILEYKGEILNVGFEQEMKNAVEGDALAYEVRDEQGERIYAYDVYGQLPIMEWDTKRLLSEQKQVIGILRPKVIRYFPIVEAGRLKGSMVVAYTMSNSAEGKALNWIAQNMNLILVVAPFVYLVFFTLIYASKFLRTIEGPLQELSKGIKAIEEHNLDVSLNSDSNDELGELTRSFETMRLALKEALEVSWKQEEERKNLISSLSHDLRTPVTIIKGYTEMLMDTVQDEIVIKKIEAIDHNIDRLMKLVEDIHEINHLHQLEYKMRPEVIDFQEELSKMVKDYKLLLGEKKLDLEWNLKLNKVSYTLDRHAFREMMDNLISNSIRFTPVGGSISTAIVEGDKGVDVIVEDSGCGFTEETLLHGLSLFYQEDTSRNNKEHAGIGLYAVQMIAKKMGAEVKLYNTAYGGAGVKITNLQIK